MLYMRASAETTCYELEEFYEGGDERDEGTGGRERGGIKVSGWELVVGGKRTTYKFEHPSLEPTASSYIYFTN